MLKVSQLSKSYADRPVLRSVAFTISEGERVGLIGPNGCGKTTLLRIVLGQETADAGQVQIAPGVRPAYLAQGLDAPEGATVQAVLDAQLGDPQAAEAALSEAAHALSQAPDSPAAQTAYAEALERLQTVDENTDPARVAAVLKQLGLDAVPRDQPVATLSGGQKTRLGLARVLLARPRLLILDEPTNHLDLEMLAWLEGWLTGFRGAVLAVSHDRAFLDATVTRILELDPATQTLRAYAGNYADYLDQKRAEIEQHWQAYGDWQTEVARLRNAARHLRGLAKLRRGGKADDGDKFAKGFFNDQSARMVQRAKHVEQRLERLLTDERAEKPKRAWQMKLAFDGAPVSGRDVLRLEALSAGYAASEQGPGAVLLRDLNLLVRHGERIALIGPNGSGKTTLVRTLLGQLAPLAGRAQLGANVRVGYFAQEHDHLAPDLNALETVRALSRQPDTELRGFLHFFLFEGDEVFTPVADLSFGERARLVLATLVAQGCNFLVLDEPINHLDIPSRERFEQALEAFDGTALIIAHDRYFVDRFATQVWKVSEGRLAVYATLAEALGLEPPAPDEAALTAE